jgi:hypothetical protein
LVRSLFGVWFVCVFSLLYKAHNYNVGKLATPTIGGTISIQIVSFSTISFTVTKPAGTQQNTNTMQPWMAGNVLQIIIFNQL